MTYICFILIFDLLRAVEWNQPLQPNFPLSGHDQCIRETFLNPVFKSRFEQVISFTSYVIRIFLKRTDNFI